MDKSNMRADEFVYVVVELFFKIINSQVFGGEGTTGYTCLQISNVKNLDRINDIAERKRIVTTQLMKVAKFMKVDSSNVALISKEEFDENTENEEGEE